MMLTINHMDRVPPTASDCEAAYAVYLDEFTEPSVTIEYAEGGAARYASSLHASTLVRDYLNHGELPPRLIVIDHAGNAQLG